MDAIALRARGLVAASVLGLHANSCGRVGYDLRAITDGGQLGAAGAPGGSGGGASTTTGGTDGASGGRAATGTGGSTSAGGSASGGTLAGGSPGGGAGGVAAGGVGGGPGTGGSAAADGGSPGDASVQVESGAPDGSGPGCGSPTGTVQTWSFDSQTEGWVWSANLGTGALSWTGSTGNPSPGALVVDLQSGAGLVGWIINYFPSPTDLGGRRASAWVWLDSGTDVGVKLFAQSETASYEWADGGFFPLTAGTWTCVTLDLGAPVYAAAGFNPAIIGRLGLEIGGTSPLRLVVDQIAY